MKLILLIVCTFVAITVINATIIIKKDGTKCNCRLKTCADGLSCEDHNALCLINHARALEKRKDCKYNKVWIADWRHEIEKRGRCTKACGKKCNEEEHQKCVQLAFDRFQCSWSEKLAEILKQGTKEAVDALQNDLDEIGVDCVNIDCKPQCQGNSECKSHLGQGEKECVEKAWNSIKKNIKDEGIREVLDNGRDASLRKIKELKECNAIKCPNARKACIDRVEREAKLGLAVYLELLVGLAGECSAKSVDALVQQRLALCNLRAKKPTK